MEDNDFKNESVKETDTVKSKSDTGSLTENDETKDETAVIRKDSDTFSKIFEWISLFLLYFSIGMLIILLFFRHSPVKGTSMYPTLNENDLLIVSTFGYIPKNGDIIVCQSQAYGLDRPLVKRVIAKGGQKVSIDYDTWQVTVDGQVLSEEYVNKKSGEPMRPSDYLPAEFTVPEGKLFVMGDNRNASADSRSSAIGLIDERCVIGKVKCKIFPFKDFKIFK